MRFICITGLTRTSSPRVSNAVLTNMEGFQRQRTLSSDTDNDEPRKRTHSSSSACDEPARKRTVSSSSAWSDSAEESTDTETHSAQNGGGSEQPAQQSSTQHETNSDLPYSSMAQKMMAKMGYKQGKGLGKYETGRVDIIEASKQRGLRGLGLKLKGLESDPNAKWDEQDPDQVLIKQYPDWIPISASCSTIPPLEELNTWVSMEERKETIDDEDGFIEQDILKGILENKTLFDNLTGNELNHARSRANPYETIRGAIFQNRAAMKMAEMDASFDYMFTEHKDRKKDDVGDLLYFSDICAGPGGFSEYVLWKEKWQAKGFGFTLRAAWANDFKLSDFISGTPETFDCHYGVGGYKGDGDVYKQENLAAFQQYVKENTDNLGVHFVMADGGFSVEGKENIQEILSKQLYLCQFLCAMNILRIGGHFVCKVFDVFTPFSVGLVYLMYRAFERVCIFKPVTSRPANSERYLVCEGLRSGHEPIRAYMTELNSKINNLKGSNIDIREIVPHDTLKQDTEFFDYMFSSNNAIGNRQILGLQKLVTYIKNTSLVGPDQNEVKKQCLEAWGVPNIPRTGVSRNDPEVHYDRLSSRHSLNWMNYKHVTLTQTLLEHIKSVHDYKCSFSGGERVYLFSLGRHSVFQWNPRDHREPTWTRVNRGNFELPRNTVIDAEFVMEFVGDGRGQHKSLALHIFDVICLGDDYVGDKSLSDRCRYAETFTKALSKNCRNDVVRIRAKPYFGFNDIETSFNELEVKQMKKVSERRLTYSFEDGRYFVPQSVYFVRRLKEPWHLQYSRSSKRLYFYNSKTNESGFVGKKESVADVRYCTENIMKWDMEQIGHGNASANITKDDIFNFVSSK